MRFPAETRVAIYGSQGRAIEIDWPEGRVIPERHHSYTVQSSRKAATLRIVVLRVIDHGLRAEVKIDGDPIRLLGKGGGYTTRPAHAISAEDAPSKANALHFPREPEPEALGEAETAELTRRVKRDRLERITSDLDGIYEAIAKAQENPDLSKDSELRFMRSLAQKLEARKTREDIRYLADLQEAS